LKESCFSVSRYLQQYEAKWEAAASTKELADYPARTLHTTWDISVARIKATECTGRALVEILAYLDNRDIWYDLFRRYQGTNAPGWFTQLTQSEGLVRESHENSGQVFLSSRRVLKLESYSVHVCVHDWTLHGLNREVDAEQYWLAFDCMAGPHCGQ